MTPEERAEKILSGTELHFEEDVPQGHLCGCVEYVAAQIREAVEEAKNTEWDHGYSAGKHQAFRAGFESAKLLVAEEAARIATVYLETAGMRPKALANEILKLKALQPSAHSAGAQGKERT